MHTTSNRWLIISTKFSWNFMAPKFVCFCHKKEIKKLPRIGRVESAYFFFAANYLSRWERRRLRRRDCDGRMYIILGE